LRKNLANFNDIFLEFVPESFRWTDGMSHPGEKFSISKNVFMESAKFSTALYANVSIDFVWRNKFAQMRYY